METDLALLSPIRSFYVGKMIISDKMKFLINNLSKKTGHLPITKQILNSKAVSLFDLNT